MTDAWGSVGVVVLAKAPVPGRVKTRMRPSLGDEECAELQRCMTRDVLQRYADVAGRWLAVAGDDPLWDEARSLGWTVVEQVPEHLGARMWQAAQHPLRAHGRALVLGTDAPHVPQASVQAIVEALDAHDVAWVPAEDGGYVAIAVGDAARPVFGALDWGTDRVAAQTAAAADRAGLRWWAPDASYDLDEIADLRRLWVDSPSCAPATVAFAQRAFDRFGWARPTS